VEFIESLLGQEACCPIVKVGIELVDDALEPQYGEQSARES
jgi:hypothetical protein